MKRTLLYFSLFTVSFSFCKAQDTIVFNNGKKIGVKVQSFEGGRINYTDATGRLEHCRESSVNNIHYSSGERLTINRMDRGPTDTLHKKWFITLSGGGYFPGLGTSSDYTIPVYWYLQDNISGGWCANVTGTYMLTSFLGATARAGYNYTAIEEYLPYINVGNANFNVQEYLTGFDLIPHNKIGTQPYLIGLIGLVVANYPTYVDLTNPYNPYTNSQLSESSQSFVNGGTGYGFGYTFGAGLLFNNNGIVHIDLSLTIGGTDIHYNDFTITHYVNNAYSWTGKYSPTLDMSIVQLTFGFSINFLKKK
jgi:hypothetical protein